MYDSTLQLMNDINHAYDMSEKRGKAWKVPTLKLRKLSKHLYTDGHKVMMTLTYNDSILCGIVLFDGCTISYEWKLSGKYFTEKRSLKRALTLNGVLRHMHLAI